VLLKQFARALPVIGIMPPDAVMGWLSTTLKNGVPVRFPVVVTKSRAPAADGTPGLSNINAELGKTLSPVAVTLIFENWPVDASNWYDPARTPPLLNTPATCQVSAAALS
jgi:hypothetical protein